MVSSNTPWAPPGPSFSIVTVNVTSDGLPSDLLEIVAAVAVTAILLRGAGPPAACAVMFAGKPAANGRRRAAAATRGAINRLEQFGLLYDMRR